MLSWSTVQFRKIIKASAIYDIVVLSAFATPWSFDLVYREFSFANQQMGGAPLEPFAAIPKLIACLLGTMVLTWAALRLSDTQLRYGRFDSIARFVSLIWMAWALEVTGAPLLWIFLIPEATLALLQALPIRDERIP